LHSPRSPLTTGRKRTPKKSPKNSESTNENSRVSDIFKCKENLLWQIHALHEYSEFLGDFFGVLFLPVVKGDRGECNLLPGVPLEFLLLVFAGVGGPGF
jgi:hypothetical protein